MLSRLAVTLSLIFWSGADKADAFIFNNCELLDLERSFKHSFSAKFYPSSGRFKFDHSGINWDGKMLRLKRLNKPGHYTAFFFKNHLHGASTSGDVSKLNLHIKPDGTGSIKVFMNSRREDKPVKFVCASHQNTQEKEQEAKKRPPTTTIGAASSQGGKRCYPNRKGIKAVQRYLSDLGLYLHKVDGIVGPGTKAAIREAKTLVGAKASTGECLTLSDISEFRYMAIKKVSRDTCQTSAQTCSPAMLCQLVTISNDTSVNWTTALQWKTHLEEAKVRGLSCNVNVEKPLTTAAESKYILFQLIEFVRLNPSAFDLNLAVNFDKVREISEGQWSPALGVRFDEFKNYLSNFPKFQDYLTTQIKQKELEKNKLIIELNSQFSENLSILKTWAELNILDKTAAQIAELITSLDNQDLQQLDNLNALLLKSEKLLSLTKNPKLEDEPSERVDTQNSINESFNHDVNSEKITSNAMISINEKLAATSAGDGVVDQTVATEIKVTNSPEGFTEADGPFGLIFGSNIKLLTYTISKIYDSSAEPTHRSIAYYCHQRIDDFISPAPSKTMENIEFDSDSMLLPIRFVVAEIKVFDVKREICLYYYENFLFKIFINHTVFKAEEEKVIEAVLNKKYLQKGGLSHSTLQSADISLGSQSGKISSGGLYSVDEWQSRDGVYIKKGVYCSTLCLGGITYEYEEIAEVVAEKIAKTAINKKKKSIEKSDF